jgi:hypothetical protein
MREPSTFTARVVVTRGQDRERQVHDHVRALHRVAHAGAVLNVALAVLGLLPAGIGGSNGLRAMPTIFFTLRARSSAS